MTLYEPVNDYFLDLTSENVTKGTSGKIAVIGGSPVFTGAPYYAAYAPLRIGADLSFVYTSAEAAPVIKSYSPDLIVHPGHGWDSIKERLDKFDSIIFGPGLGKDLTLFPLLRQLLEEVKNRTDKMSLVIDADGLYLVEKNIELLKGCTNVILTPNHREFNHLWEAAFPSKQQSNSMTDNVKQVAQKLGVCVCRKGSADIISDGEHVISCSDDTTPRRCGGQGDLLSGAIGVFCHWAGIRFKDASNPKTRMLRGAYAACRFIRYTGYITFKDYGRSMTATDMISCIGKAVYHFQPKF